MKKDKNKKETGLRGKINKLKETSRGSAIWKLIKWGIFFFVLLLICVVGAFMPHNGITLKKEDSVPEVNVPKEDEIKEYLKTEDVEKLVNELKTNTYRYQIKASSGDIHYTYEGYKGIEEETGYR